MDSARPTPVHIVLTGNPGTGKTTIACKLGEVFKAIGLLPTDKVVEKERKHLISTYQNETLQFRFFLKSLTIQIYDTNIRIHPISSEFFIYQAIEIRIADIAFLIRMHD